MTESTLVDAQGAYINPRLAALATARHHEAFARQLRAEAARDLRVGRGHWTAGGWYARDCASDREIGSGAIFGEPQPWAILAGASNSSQARMLVARIRRHLMGVGAPADRHGPSRIGSSDPGITDDTHPGNAAIAAGAAVCLGAAGMPSTAG